MVLRKHVWVQLAIACLAAVSASRPVLADALEVRIARQFSMGYLQYDVMNKEGLIEKHAKALGLDGVKTTWTIINGPAAMNDALLSDSLDIVMGGMPGLLTLWARTKGTPQEIKGIAALTSQPILLNTRNPNIKALKDYTDQDKIAVPTIKVSIQAIVLQMAAAKQFGEASYAKLDPLTVSMSPPDSQTALMGGSGTINSVFGVAPFQNQQLDDPAIHTVLNSFDVFGGPHTFTGTWTSRRFHDQNPILYKALINALKEATEKVNANKRLAASYWVENTKSKIPLDAVEKIVAGPQVRWTLSPEKFMEFADFMHKTGSIKVKPDKWQDCFFPEVHDLPGS